MTAANRVGRYEIIRKLAVGGMAEVFLAKMDGPAGFQKNVVLKRILPNLARIESFATMFLNEARLAALLNHPNIVQIIELGQEGETYYIAMEYVDGPSVGGLIRAAQAKGQKLPVDVVAKIISQACEGLAFAHESVGPEGEPLKLIHRDISPDNILLARSGSVKVADFGIAKAANLPSVTQTGMLKGKISYLPPEAFTGKPIDQRADVFAMGVVLYEMITAAKPFIGDGQVEVMEAIIRDKPKPLSAHRADTTSELQAIVDKALSKDLSQRFRDPGSMQADLESFLMKRQSSVRSADIASLISQLVPATRSTGGFGAVSPSPGPAPKPASQKLPAVRPGEAKVIHPVPSPPPPRSSSPKLEALPRPVTASPPDSSILKTTRAAAMAPPGDHDDAQTILHMPRLKLDSDASDATDPARATDSSSPFGATLGSRTNPLDAETPWDPPPLDSGPHRRAPAPSPVATPLALASEPAGARRKSMAPAPLPPSPFESSPATAVATPVGPRRSSVSQPLDSLGPRPSHTPNPHPPRPQAGGADDDLLPTERQMRAVVLEMGSPPREPGAPPAKSPRKGSSFTVPLVVLVTSVAVCVLIVVGLREFLPNVFGGSASASIDNVKVVEVQGNRLVVESEPPGADVFVQTAHIGVTPLNVDNQYPQGTKLTLSVSMLGVAPVVTEIEGGRGQMVHVTLRAPLPKK